MSEILTSADAPDSGVDKVASILDGYEDSTSVSAGLTGYEKLAAEPKAETKTDEGETFPDFDELVRTQAAVQSQSGFEELVTAAGDVLLDRFAEEAGNYFAGGLDLNDRHSAELALGVLIEGVETFGEAGLEAGVNQLVEGLGCASLADLAEEDPESFAAVLELVEGVGETLQARQQIALEQQADALERDMAQVEIAMFQEKANEALRKMHVPESKVAETVEGLVAVAHLAGIDLDKVKTPEELEKTLFHLTDISNAAQRKLDEAPIRSILTRSMGRGVADVQRELSGDYLDPYVPQITEADVKAERLAREERELRENVSNIDIKAALSGAGKLRLSDGLSGQYPRRPGS